MVSDKAFDSKAILAVVLVVKFIGFFLRYLEMGLEVLVYATVKSKPSKTTPRDAPMSSAIMSWILRP